MDGATIGILPCTRRMAWPPGGSGAISAGGRFSLTPDDAGDAVERRDRRAPPHHRGRLWLSCGALSLGGVRRRRGASGRGWGTATRGQGGATGDEPEGAHDQAEDGQGAGRGGIVFGLITLGNQGGLGAGGFAVQAVGELGAAWVLDRVLGLGRVAHVREGLGAAGEGLVDPWLPMVPLNLKVYWPAVVGMMKAR